jgi:DNA-binding PucR family transcriptional regulator
MCNNPLVDTDRPKVAELMASVAAAVSRRIATVTENVYQVALREIPELHDDQAVLALFTSSIESNIGTCLQVMQHQIDLAAVHAPAAALEEARRRAQRGTALTALLRAYRLGHTVVLDWVLEELARQSDDARMLTPVTMGISKIVAGYVDQTSEEIVAAYAQERENWLRNRSAVRAARVRELLSGQRVNAGATEAALGYRLRQYHLGVVCWSGDVHGSADNITRLDRAIGQVAAQTGVGADPVFLPRDESSAWAWLPLGIRDRFDAAAASAAALDGDLHVAFGDVVKGIAGFRLTHQQAVAAQSVALAGGSPPRVVTYAEVAPVAMMLGSPDLLRGWVLSTLGQLATDDEHHARLRHTLLVFLDSGGSYKATAERLTLHKNTVQYRIRKAEESLGRPVGQDRHDVELALQASRWLGSSVLQPTAGRDLARRLRPRRRPARPAPPPPRRRRPRSPRACAARGRARSARSPGSAGTRPGPCARSAAPAPAARPVPRPASPPTRPARPRGPRPRRRRRASRSRSRCRPGWHPRPPRASGQAPARRPGRRGPPAGGVWQRRPGPRPGTASGRSGARRCRRPTA